MIMPRVHPRPRDELDVLWIHLSGRKRAPAIVALDQRSQDGECLRTIADVRSGSVKLSVQSAASAFAGHVPSYQTAHRPAMAIARRFPWAILGQAAGPFLGQIWATRKNTLCRSP